MSDDLLNKIVDIVVDKLDVDKSKVTEDAKFDEALGHLRMAQELAEDEYSLNSIQVLKDDIRKKKADF